MKIKLVCTKCMSAKNTEEFFKNFKLYNVLINDEGVYRIKCSEGHTIEAVLQNPKFELLFDYGMMALIDGYTREAVASWTASLERFIEFTIKVIVANNEIDDEKFKNTWKHLKNSSQMQLGSYYLMYLLNFKEPPKTLDDNKKGFRNKVIHKGKIPDLEETKDYGEYIYNYIKTILNDLKVFHNEDIMHIISNELREKHELTKTHNISTSVIPTALSCVSSSGDKEFIEVLNDFNKKDFVYEF